MDECLPSQTAEISYACVFLHLVMAMSRLLTDEGRSFVQLLLQDYRLVSSSQSGLTNLLTFVRLYVTVPFTNCDTVVA